MVFSKSNIALLALALGATNISNSFAIPGDERALPRFTPRQIISFIQGKDNFSDAPTRQGLMQAAYTHLTDEMAQLDSDFERNWPSIAKHILGLAELLQNHPTRALPGMTSYASARHVMALLSEIILSPEGIDAKHVNYAKIYWGQLLVKRIGIEMTEGDKNYAWAQLSLIGSNYTKIGNVYRASLLLENGYIPEDVTYNEHSVAQIGLYAQNLLNASYSDTRVKRIRTLNDLARELRESEDRPAEVAADEAMEAPTPENLTEKDARALRKALVRTALHRAEADRQPADTNPNDDPEHNLMDSESSGAPAASGSKRSRDEFESSNLESDSDHQENRSSEPSSRKGNEHSELNRVLLTNHPNGSQNELDSDSSGLGSDNDQDLSSSNTESRRSPTILSVYKLQRFVELYNQYSGPVLHEKLRSEVLTPEQSASFESKKQFKAWLSNTRITAQEKGFVLPSKIAKSIPLTDAQFTQISDHFKESAVSIDDTFRRTVWTFLTDGQKSCFPEGYNSMKFANYLNHVRHKFTQSGITFRK